MISNQFAELRLKGFPLKYVTIVEKIYNLKELTSKSYECTEEV